MKPREFCWPEGHWDWYQHLAFKHGVKAGELIFVGGQVDKTDKGEPLNAFDLQSQTAKVVGHIGTVLAGLGSSLADVTKLVAFYVNDGSVDGQTFIADVGRRFQEGLEKPIVHGPAITAVPLPCLALPGMMVEIEAIAMPSKDTHTLERCGVNPDALAPLPQPFTHGLRVGQHTWISAQSPRDSSGHIACAGDPVAQSAVIMENIETVLSALDLEREDIVKVGCWFDGDGTTNAWKLGAIARSAHFQHPGPAVTELPSPCLPNGESARLEAWAMRGESGEKLSRQWKSGEAWQWPLCLAYSHGLRCEDFVFLSAHLPLDHDGQTNKCGDLNDQTRQVMTDIDVTLQSFGLDLNHMVKQTSFFLGKADPADIVTNQTLRSSYYTEPAGASTGVPMPYLTLDGVMVSVDTIAML